MRIGHGYDVHKFCEGNSLVLGGVTIPHTQGLLAHSDGDVLLHALIDALLGACALGDIGQLYPDTDDTYAGIDSRILLRQAYERVQSKGYIVCNADITVIAQTPKMSPYTAQMKTTIAADLQCDASQINVKATTTETLGFTGRKEGIATHAVVLLVANND